MTDKAKLLLAGALFLHLVLGGSWLLTVPAGEAPDEADYIWGVWLMERTWELPLSRGTAGMREDPSLLWREYNLGHQPPLYFMLLAGIERLLWERDLAPTWRNNEDYYGKGGNSPNKEVHGWDEFGPHRSAEIGALRLLRGVSLLCGAVLVWAAWALGRLLYPGRPGIAGGAALALAGLPQFSFNFAILDSGNLAAALAAPGLVLLTACLVRGRMSVGEGILLGLSAGLAALAKLTALYLPLAGALVLAAALVRRPRAALPWLRPALAAAVAFLLLTGWFFARNLHLYGDLTGEGPKLLGFADNRVPEGRLWEHLVECFLPGTWHSFVGNFGWVCIPLPGWLTTAVLLLPLAALAGWLTARRELVPGRGPALLFGLAAIAAGGGLLLRYNLRYIQPQGRYLFTVIPWIGLLVAAGLAGLAGRMPRLRGLGPAAALLWIALGLWTCFGFYPPQVRPGNPWSDPHHAALTFGLCTPPSPGQPRIETLSPPPGARCGTPPTFRWRLPAGWEGRPVTLHFIRPEGFLIGATGEWLKVKITGGEWTFPAPHWGAMPRGMAIGWKVRVLPDRQRGEAVAAMPESPIATFRIP